MSEKTERAEIAPVRELDEPDLQAVVGGDAEVPAAQTNIMKTKHDTVKNSISNVR